MPRKGDTSPVSCYTGDANLGFLGVQTALKESLRGAKLLYFQLCPGIKTGVDFINPVTLYAKLLRFSPTCTHPFRGVKACRRAQIVLRLAFKHCEIHPRKYFFFATALLEWLEIWTLRSAFESLFF